MRKAIIILAILLLPVPAHAKTFYITQGLGCESWVVALSTGEENVELIHEAYGDGVVRDERLRTFAIRKRVSFWPAA